MQQIILAIIIGFLSSTSALAVEQKQANLLVYKVWEPATEAYISRILVSPDFVRLDEGEDEKDFTLFNRKQGTIYNVSNDDKSVLVLEPKEMTNSNPKALKLAETITPDLQAPKVAGQQPRKVVLLTDGEVCRELVTIEGVMAEALAGLAEFYRQLGKLQVATLTDESPSVCELSEFLYASDRALKFGLPLQEQYMGKRLLLLDFNPLFDINPDLFKIPDDYQTVSMPAVN